METSQYLIIYRTPTTNFSSFRVSYFFHTLFDSRMLCTIYVTDSFEYHARRPLEANFEIEQRTNIQNKNMQIKAKCSSEEFLIIEKSNSHNMTEKTANKAVICSSSQEIILKKRERKNVVQIKAGRVTVTKQRWPRARDDDERGERRKQR